MTEHKKLKVVWLVDVQEELKLMEKWLREADWIPHFNWLYGKLHMWAYRYGGCKWHDWLITSWWYQKWGNWRYYCPQQNPFRNQADETAKTMRAEIDREVIREIEKSLKVNDE